MSKQARLVSPMLAAALLVLGCATNDLPFRAAPALPAATATAKVRPEPDGKAAVKLRVEHLAPPSRLTPPRGMYILWAQNPDGETVRLGRLQVNDDLETGWRGSVPFDDFRLVITGEDFAAPQQPSFPEILATEFVKVGPKRWYRF